MNKRYNFWLSEEELNYIKKKAVEEKRSMANWIKTKLFKERK